jgi:hypothetical protein
MTELAFEQPAPAQQQFDANALAGYSPFQMDASTYSAPMNQSFAPEAQALPSGFPNPQIDFASGGAAGLQTGAEVLPPAGAEALAPAGAEVSAPQNFVPAENASLAQPAEQLSPEQQKAQQDMGVALESFMTLVRDTYSDQIPAHERKNPTPEDFSAQLDTVLATAQQAGSLDAQSAGQIMQGDPAQALNEPFAQPVQQMPVMEGQIDPNAAMPVQMAPEAGMGMPAGMPAEVPPETAMATPPQAAPLTAPQTAPVGMTDPAAMAGDPAAAMGGDPAAAMGGDPSAAMGGDPSAAMAGDPSAAMAGDPSAAMAGDPSAAMAEGQPDTMQFANPEVTQSPENMQGQAAAASPEQQLQAAKGQLLQMLEAKRGQTMTREDLQAFAQLLTICVAASYEIGRKGGAAGAVEQAPPAQLLADPSTVL